MREASPLGHILSQHGASADRACAGIDDVDARGFRWKGNYAISGAKPTKVVQAVYAGARTYDLAGLRMVAAAVTCHYRQHGYIVAAACIPRRTPTDGVIAAAGASRVAIKAVAAVRQKPSHDDACSDERMRRDLPEAAPLGIGDAPRRKAIAQLAPGRQEGSSQLVDSDWRRTPVLTPGADSLRSQAVGQFQAGLGWEVHEHIDAGLFARPGLLDWLIADYRTAYVKAYLHLIEDREKPCALELACSGKVATDCLFDGRPEILGQFFRDLVTESSEKSDAPPETVPLSNIVEEA